MSEKNLTEATALPTEWRQEDAVTLRQFLQTHPRILVALWQQRGQLKAGDHSAADEIAGYERCFSNLKRLASDLPPVDTNESIDITED